MNKEKVFSILLAELKNEENSFQKLEEAGLKSEVLRILQYIETAIKNEDVEKANELINEFLVKFGIDKLRLNIKDAHMDIEPLVENHQPIINAILKDSE